MPVAKPLLLIVDDDSLISESLSFAFAQEYDVLTSHSRAHARSLVRQLRNPPRLALVDLGCREQTDYRQRHLKTQFDLENQFIADHSEELDALKARAGQARR